MRRHTSEVSTTQPQLRQRAEAALQQTPARLDRPDVDLQQVLHELQIHQAELAIQNEDLREQQYALAVSRDQYMALYDGAPAGYVTLDTRGGILEANLTAATLLGVSRRSLVGTSLTHAIVRDDQDTFYFHRNRVFETQTVQTCDLRMQRPDGTVFMACLESWSLAEETGPATRCFTILSDITARTQAEEALRQAHDSLEQRVLERTTALAAAYDEIRGFSHLVAHDLHAPLITVQGFTRELARACEALQVVLPTALPYLDQAQRALVSTTLESDIPESLSFICAGVARMDTLLEALSTLARMGHRPLHYETVDMETLVQQCVQTLTQQLREPQREVTVGPLPSVQADALAMTQIVSNLLSNAIHALEPGRPGALRITATTRPEATAFHIQDNGRGIAAQDIPRVFEVFRRLDPQETPGTGMGLAYVRTLVHRHGGDVTCHSTPGVGTTFTFTIANAPAADSPPPTAGMARL
jgi:PAS domain S-box-containing protein